MGVRLEDRGHGVWTMPGARIVDRTGKRRLAIGESDFVSAMRTGTLVDKTLLIADVLDSGYKATLFCRPRRFGKTLNMTMTRAYLEAPEAGGIAHEDAVALFAGTEVWEADSGSYRQYLGAYPVVHLSLSTTTADSWCSCYGAIKEAMANEYLRHNYLRERGNLLPEQKAFFTRIASKAAVEDDEMASLASLCRMLATYHGTPVVLLIDEYDAPVMTGHTKGYYNQVVSFMRRWLTGAVKDGGPTLAFACLTGVQRISKESIFSGLNNLYVSTPLGTDFDERYGFTDAEVEALATYLGYPGCMPEAREWYDGYRFGAQDVYNPWSVLNYLRQGCRPGTYWGNTSGNAVVGDLVRHADAKTLESIYALLEPGGTVEEPLDLGVVFPDLGIRDDALWSMLYLAGYLTTNDVEDPSDDMRLRELRIPDQEVARLFRNEVLRRFQGEAGGRDRLSVLHLALVAGDERTFAQELGRVARDSMSSFDLVSELPCHALLMGLLFGVQGYLNPTSNREAGYGRYDIRLEPDPAPHGRDLRPLITVEVKYQHGADDKALDKLAHEALEQIASRDYDVEIPQGVTERLRWGVAFSGKRVACACQKEL